MISPERRRSRQQAAEEEQQLIAYRQMKKAKRKRRWRIVRRIFLGLFLVVLIVAMTLSVLIGHAYVQAKSKLSHLQTEMTVKKPSQIRILDNQGKLIYTNRIQEPVLVSAADLPTNLDNALLSIEDRHFFTEKYGLNPQRIAIALVHNVSSKQQFGASTLDQQLIKEVFWGTKNWKRSYSQKLQEMVLTVKLDQLYSKKQILASYYNHINFGNLQTMGGISEYYCGKPVQKLNINQAAMLAGMVQAPSNYDPYRHPETARKRRNTVLDAMVANGKLSKHEANKIKDEPLALVDPKVHRDFAKQQQVNLINDNFAITAALNQGRTLGKSYTIQTSVNQEIQQQLVKIVNSFKYPNKHLETAVTVMNAKNGQVVAQVGGVNQKSIGAYNRAIAPNRSTGSTIKPVLDYVAAMHYLGWGTQTTVQDEPYNYPGTDTQVHDWDDKYQGDETVRKALVESRNVPAVKALVQVGLNQGLSMISQSGFNKKLWYADAIGLNTSTQTLASMYTGLANGGQMSAPQVLTKINGKVVPANTKQVYSAGTAFMITDILKGVVQKGQFGQDAIVDGVTQAGKTGTVGFPDSAHKPKDALSDAWFVGYTPQYVIVVWNGFDHSNGNDYLKDGNTPIQLEQQIVQMLKNQPGWNDPGWTMPNDVKSVDGGYAFAHWTRPNDAQKVTPKVNKPSSSSKAVPAPKQPAVQQPSGPTYNTTPQINSAVQQQEQQQNSQWQSQGTESLGSNEVESGGYVYEYVP